MHLASDEVVNLGAIVLVGLSEARRRIHAAAERGSALQYLEEALLEAEAAPRWYAQRSPSAALAFSDEIDIVKTRSSSPRN